MVTSSSVSSRTWLPSSSVLYLPDAFPRLWLLSSQGKRRRSTARNARCRVLEREAHHALGADHDALHSDDLGAYAPAVDGVFLDDEPCLAGVLAALWFARQHPAGDGADHASAVANLGRRGASVGLYQCGERGGVFPQRDSGCCGELDHGLPYGRVRAS